MAAGPCPSLEPLQRAAWGSGPTQGEVIQLLGQLHAANLLYVELAPDSEALFTATASASPARCRIPDEPPVPADSAAGPEPVPGSLGGDLRLGVQLVRIAPVAGARRDRVYFIIGDIPELLSQSEDVLDPSNLVFLY